MDTRTQFKIGLSVLAVVCLWQIAQSQAVSEAFLQFIAAGVVPGTNKTLSPTAVFWFLGILLGLSVLLIFHDEIERSARWALKLLQRKPKELPVAQTATGEPAPAVVITLPRKPGALAKFVAWQKQWIRAMLTHTPQAMQTILSAIGKRMNILLHMGLVAVQILKALAKLAVRYTRRGLVAAARIAGLLLVAGVILAADLAERAWIRFEPHARRFDRWLEHELHQNEQTALVLRGIREVAQTFHGWFMWLQTFKTENLSRSGLQRKQD